MSTVASSSCFALAASQSSCGTRRLRRPVLGAALTPRSTSPASRSPPSVPKCQRQAQRGRYPALSYFPPSPLFEYLSVSAQAAAKYEASSRTLDFGGSLSDILGTEPASTRSRPLNSGLAWTRNPAHVEGGERETKSAGLWLISVIRPCRPRRAAAPRTQRRHGVRRLSKAVYEFVQHVVRVRLQCGLALCGGRGPCAARRRRRSSPDMFAVTARSAWNLRGLRVFRPFLQHGFLQELQIHIVSTSMRWPDCSAPRRFPAPRISRSRIAMRKPELNSANSLIASSLFSAISVQHLCPALKVR